MCGGADIAASVARELEGVAADIRDALKGVVAATFGFVGVAVEAGAWPLVSAVGPVACSVTANKGEFAWDAFGADFEVSCMRLARRSDVLNANIG